MKYSYFNKSSINDLIDEITYVYKSDNRPWIIGFSGGKDSSVVVQLVYGMLQRLTPEERHKEVYIVSSDTMVENPIIKNYLHSINREIGLKAEAEKLRITSKMVYPDPSNTFWANIIGRGFPTPRLNGSFRWCTDRLKIAPSGVFIKEIIGKHNSEVVILLGTRKAESQARKKRIESRELAGKVMNRHASIDKAYVYAPIVELTTDDVWTVILSNKQRTPWGTDNSMLVKLYSDADSGECPFAGISSKDEQHQSCGKSRFGCWVCPVVKEDKSLNGFIKSGHRELIPLAKFRKWLMDNRDNEKYREKKRRDGRVYKLQDGRIGFGPFTWEARQMILRELLETEKKMGIELISEEELKAIDKIWDDEVDLTRRTLVELYYDVVGKKLPWHDFKKPLFEENVVNRVTELSSDIDLHYDLVRDLILSAHRNKNYTNPKKLKDGLEKVMGQQWVHYDLLKEFDNEN